MFTNKFTTMKRILLFSALLATTSLSFAQWQNRGGNEPKYDNRNSSNYRTSAVVIKAFTEKRFTVMIDNMQYELNSNYSNTRRDNFINIGNINPGRHSITVFETRNGLFGKARQKVVYSSYSFFKPGVETTLGINNYGDVSFSEKQLNYGRDNRRDDDRRDNNRRDNDRDDNGGWRH